MADDYINEWAQMGEMRQRIKELEAELDRLMEWLRKSGIRIPADLAAQEEEPR